MEDHAPILDQPEERKKPRELLMLGYGAVLLLATGLVMRLYQLPGSVFPIGISMVLMIIRHILLAFRSGSRISGWLYLAGHVLVAGCAGVFIAGWIHSRLIFLLPLTCYALGIWQAWKTDTQKED